LLFFALEKQVGGAHRASRILPAFRTFAEQRNLRLELNQDYAILAIHLCLDQRAAGV